jgi:hypothetical protein
MKKLTVLAFVGAALLFTACNDKKETVTAEQEVAAKTGEVYKVDLATVCRLESVPQRWICTKMGNT